MEQNEANRSVNLIGCVDVRQAFVVALAEQIKPPRFVLGGPLGGAGGQNSGWRPTEYPLANFVRNSSTTLNRYKKLLARGKFLRPRHFTIRVKRWRRLTFARD